MSGDVGAFTRFERDGWDRIPHGYDRCIGHVTERAAGPLLDATGIRPGDRLLDVATGPGYLVGDALARGADVVGVDLSAEILVLAQARHPAARFRVADALDLPFDAASFEAVTAGFLLPHVADPARGVRELSRVLVPGGVIGLSTWAEPDQVPLLGAVVAAVAEVDPSPPADVPPGPPFFAYSDPPALAELLTASGLTDVTVTTCTFPHRVASPDALWDGLMQGTVRTAALVLGQPAEVQAEIRAAFDRHVAAYRTADGDLELPVAVVLATARKEA